MSMNGLSMSLSDSIVEDGRVLLGVCALLGSKTDLAEWPQPLVQALRVALKPEPGARREQSKAARLEGICLARCHPLVSKSRIYR